MPIDYKKYPPNWRSEIVPRIKARANHCCELCGVANLSHQSNGSRVILCIAHLDQDPENHAVTDDRLRALCQRCHFTYDKATQSFKLKYGLNALVNNFRLELSPMERLALEQMMVREPAYKKGSTSTKHFFQLQIPFN
jgi:methylphosphotriester-DNA--protein-cysteine methyltransferase